MQLQQFPDSQTLNAAFAEQISAQLQDAIAARGEAVLVVSGGRTPLPLFQTLANADLDWSKVTITLADDRFLPDDAPDSNERLVKSAYYSTKPQPRVLSVCMPKQTMLKPPCLSCCNELKICHALMW